MNTNDLRAIQAPLKERYRSEPEQALITLKAEGRIGERVRCSIQTGKALVEAGLHPATGGPGTFACSGDMLLEALAACAGVTMAAVATSIGVDLRGGTVRAEGDLDRTLGARTALVQRIRSRRTRCRRLLGTTRDLRSSRIVRGLPHPPLSCVPFYFSSGSPESFSARHPPSSEMAWV